jgi:NADH:ubiquinone oxidoreductase subunit 4 (subunit M)
MKFCNKDIDFQVLSKLGPVNALMNLDIILALDGLSLPFILLTGFIMPLVFISN